MKRTSQENIVRHIRKKLVKEYKPEKIILFGSRAYGKPTRGSDFDVFIIKHTRRNPLDRIRDVSRIFGLRDFSLDVIVRTPAELRRRLREGSFLYQEIVSKGRVLYEKPS